MSQQDAADVVALHTRLLDAVGQSVVATDPSGRVMYWNHAATALFGYSAAEAVGRHIGSLVLRVADEMDAAAIVAAVLGGNVRAGEFALRRKDGAVIPVWVTDAPIRDTAGDVVGIVSVSTDLTEVRQADHRIRALTAALEGIDEAVLVIDVETARISECNARAESLLGVDRSDLVGRHITEFANEEMGDQQREHMATLAAGQALPLTRTVRQRPDGTPVNLLVSITPVVDRRGVVTAGAVVLRDGDLAGEPATLRLTDDDVRRDFAEAMIPQASIDVHGNFVEVNAAMADFLRYAARALIGAPADDVYHPDERHAARNGRAALLRGDIRRLTANRRYVASDGSTLYGIARYVVVNDEHGHPDHVTVLIDDVTDVHSATDALVHAEARFRSLSHRSSDIVFVSDKDAVISYVSAAITPQYGYTSEALVGLSGFELLHPDDTETAFRAFVVAASHTVDMPPIRARMRRSDGSYVRSEITFSNLLEDPVVNGMVVNIRDITTTVRAEEDMRASDRRYRTLLESARDGVVMTDDHGIITFASERAAEILRAEVDQLVGSLGASWLLVDDAWVETARSSRIDSTHVHRYEVRAKRGDGTLGWLHVSAAPQLNSDGEITGVQAVIADISEKRAAQEELARLALHDPLTGLANRTLLSDRLRRALSLAGVAAGRPVLLHVDIDDFKRVNDSLG
ncbi:MAG: diguanylate cyclase domain, partial [Frankiales bacterium]|nr:diguanylate cyclase domain [Frankiales bacterium]